MSLGCARRFLNGRQSGFGQDRIPPQSVRDPPSPRKDEDDKVFRVISVFRSTNVARFEIATEKLESSSSERALRTSKKPLRSNKYFSFAEIAV